MKFNLFNLILALLFIIVFLNLILDREVNKIRAFKETQTQAEKELFFSEMQLKGLSAKRERLSK